MKSILIILLTFLFFSYTLQACIPGENCPYNQGECTDDQCSCKDGFFTIIDSEKEEINQIFCNYEQISVKMMLLLEVLLPSSGQVYCGRYIHAAIKFVLVVSFILVSKFLTKKILIPKCFIVAKNDLLVPPNFTLISFVVLREKQSERLFSSTSSSSSLFFNIFLYLNTICFNLFLSDIC